MTAPINLTTLRQRAIQFAKEFANITAEKQHNQRFMQQFCAIFGISPWRIDYQYPVKLSHKGQTIWIDGLLRGSLLIEMKTAGKDMDEAYRQASRYVSLLPDKELPEFILISDFKTLHLYNRTTGAARTEIELADLPQQN